MPGEKETVETPEEKETTDQKTGDDKSIFVNWDTNTKDPPIDKEVQEKLREIEKNQGENTDEKEGSKEEEAKETKDKNKTIATTEPKKENTVEIQTKPTSTSSKQTTESSEQSTEDDSDNTLKVPQDSNKEDSWTKLATEQGFKVKSDDYESYLEAFNKHIENVAEEAKNEIDTDIYKRISPAAQKMLSFELNGGNYFQLQEMLNEYDKYLSLSDDNIIREEYKSQVDPSGKKFYTDERIEEILTELSEDRNKLIEKANEIRVSITDARSDAEHQMTDMQSQISDAQKSTVEDTDEDDSNAIHNALASQEDYMGKKINDEVRTYLQDQWDSGQVHQSLQDPEVMTEFMIFSAFKNQIFKDNGRKEFEKGKESIKKVLHNIPSDLGGGKRVEPQKSSETPFDSWEEAGVTVSTN